jgi:thiol-disulfide isomerase/thioredoxin
VADPNVIMNDPNDKKPKNPNETIKGNLRYIKQPDGTVKIEQIEGTVTNTEPAKPAQSSPAITTPPTNDVVRTTTDPTTPRVRFVAPKGIELDTTQEIMPLLDKLEFDPTGQFVEFKGMILNEDMPRFTLTDINGKTVTQEEMKNKIIFIDFWASWCGPCVAQFSHTKKLMEKYKNEDIIFLYISIDSDVDSWKEFLKYNPMSGIHGNDKTILPINFQVTGIPNSFIIGRNGKIAFNSRLKSKLNDDRIIQLLLKNN